MIYLDKDAREALKKGVNLLADTVKTTLGPHGNTVVLYNSEDEAYTTKDGVSVARHVFSQDKAIDAGIQLIREATAKTADVAGDGTTTSTILAQHLINACLNYIEVGVSPVSLKRGITKAAEFFNTLLKAHSKEISFDFKTLKDVATISANNDSEVGNIIAEAFIKVGKDGLVLFDMSTKDITTVDTIEGMQIQSNLLSPAFINNHRAQTAEYEEKDENPVSLLLVNNEITNLQYLAGTINYAIQNSMPIVIVAWDFSYSVLRDIIQNNMKNNTKILPIKAEGFGDNKLECLKDISAVTGANIYDNEQNTSGLGLGMCKKIIVSAFNTTIIKCEDLGNTKLNTRIQVLKEKIEAEKNPTYNKNLQEKLARLTGKMAIIHVGGITESIAKEKYDRIEDAVYATKAAIEEGICIGGGMTYTNIADGLCRLSIKEDKEGFDAIIATLYEPFNQLCVNSGIPFEQFYQYKFKEGEGYDFLNGKVVNMIDSGIIDPTKVLRIAFENAISIACLIVNTSGIITNE